MAFRGMLAPKPRQCPYLFPSDGMNGRRPILGTTDMQATLIQFHLMPLQRHHLARPQPMPVGHEDYGGVPVAVPAGFAGMGHQ
jgi:hypothetical protein